MVLSVAMTTIFNFEFIGLTLEVKTQIFSGLLLYWETEVSVLIEVIALPACKEVVMFSGVSIFLTSETCSESSKLGFGPLVAGIWNQEKSVEESQRCLIFDLFYYLFLVHAKHPSGSTC